MPPSAPQRPGDGRSKPPWVSFLPEVLKVRDQIDDPPRTMSASVISRSDSARALWCLGSFAGDAGMLTH